MNNQRQHEKSEEVSHFFTFLRDEFDTKNCMEILNTLWENDRWFDFKAFEKTAHYCADVMKKIGLAEVEMLPLKADGETIYGDWHMPQAWDANAATLTFADGWVLADYLQVPTSLVMYSAPTPPGGVRAQVVDADNISDGADLKGKIFLTSRCANEVVPLAQKAGAIGIISDLIPLYENVRENPMDLQGHSRWENTFCAPKNETGLFAFNLSPENGKLLREKMQDGDVILHASVDTKFYDGVNYVVSGAILGETDEEVLAYGHLYEPGAMDNASGCAVLLAFADCINRCIAEGKLPKPKRTLRFAMGWECVGSTAWLLADPQRQRSTIAGLVADMVGTEAIDNTFLRIWHNPMANYGFTDALIEELLPAHRKYLGDNYPAEHVEFRPGTDNIIADPYWEIPTIAFVSEPALSYHSSMDTPDRIDPAILTRCAVLIGTFMWELTQITCEEKERLDKLALDNLCETNQKLFQLVGNPDQLKTEKIPKRLIPGCLTGAAKPDADYSKWSLIWSTVLHLPLFWADGKRDLEQIIQLAAAELGRTDIGAYRAEMMEYFNFLAENGYVVFEKRRQQ